MREVKVRARPVKTGMSVIQVWKKTDLIVTGVCAVICKDFAERIVSLEVQPSPETSAYFHCTAMIRRIGVVPQQVCCLEKWVGVELQRRTIGILLVYRAEGVVKVSKPPRLSLLNQGLNGRGGQQSAKQQIVVEDG